MSDILEAVIVEVSSFARVLLLIPCMHIKTDFSKLKLHKQNERINKY